MYTTGGREAYVKKNQAKFKDLADSIKEFKKCVLEENCALLKLSIENLAETSNLEMQKFTVAISNHLIYNFETRCQQWANLQVKKQDSGISRKDHIKIINTVI